jgi:hypothetical protein
MLEELYRFDPPLLAAADLSCSLARPHILSILSRSEGAGGRSREQQQLGEKCVQTPKVGLDDS